MSQEILMSLSEKTRTISLSASAEMETKEVNRAVMISDNKLCVNENMMEEGRIYPVTYDGEEYYVKKENGVTEVFQLVETDV